MLRQPDFIPEPISAVEKEAPKELFKATLGFDFVFDYTPSGELHCFCIEINGHDSGVHGVKNIPKGDIDETHRVLAEIRATTNPEMARRYKIGNKILADLHDKIFQPSDEVVEKIYQYLAKSMRAQPTFTHAHHNPDFIEDITRDKRLQEQYVPPEHWPRTWHPGENPVSSTGWWVLKQYGSRGGDGVRMASNEDLEEVISQAGDALENYVVQEFVQPITIDDRAASMRLLVDFQYLSDGTIVPDFTTAYHRIAPYTGEEKVSADGKPITNDDIFIVNKARGAKSAAATEEEIALARDVAEKIIHNIAKEYKTHLEQTK